MLRIKELQASIGEKQILKGINLDVKDGDILALMGPNGSGKSTLSSVIMGNPVYTVTGGSVLFDGKDVLSLSPDERSKLGIFLSFQYPAEIPGVTLAHFLRAAVNEHRSEGEKLSVVSFNKLLNENLALLNMKQDFAQRYLNAGFSGGEKKITEILQMAMLRPKLALLDETDSGLDIDALRRVAEGIKKVKTKDMTIIIITHYRRILDLVKPDGVAIMLDGKIKEQGGQELVSKLEQQGYDWLNK